MAYTPKDWRNATTHEGGGDETTPISAAAIEDLEIRVTDYTDTRFMEGVVNVKDYGALGDGVTDDTDAIDAAVLDLNDFVSYGNLNGGPYIDGPPLYFPTGRYHYTTGSVLWSNSVNGTPRSVNIFGDGPQATTIVLPAGAYLVDTDEAVHSLHIHDLCVNGGAGVFRSTNTGANVLWRQLVQRCIFVGYTKAAFEINSSDWPYWTWEDCFFYGYAETGDQIAIATTEAAAAMSVTRCTFSNNLIDIKAGLGGNGLKVRDCDFIPGGWPTGGGRIPIWIVPDPATTMGGPGCEIAGNKFGNEGKVAGDYAIVYADEGAGAGVADRMPTLTSDSTAYIIGHKIGPNLILGNANWVDGNSALIYSTTPNLLATDIGPITSWGSRPDYILRLRTAAALAASNVTIGPYYSTGSTDATNATSNAIEVDPTSLLT